MSIITKGTDIIDTHHPSCQLTPYNKVTSDSRIPEITAIIGFDTCIDASSTFGTSANISIQRGIAVLAYLKATAERFAVGLESVQDFSITSFKKNFRFFFGNLTPTNFTLYPQVAMVYPIPEEIDTGISFLRYPYLSSAMRTRYGQHATAADDLDFFPIPFEPTGKRHARLGMELAFSRQSVPHQLQCIIFGQGITVINAEDGESTFVFQGLEIDP